MRRLSFLALLSVFLALPVVAQAVPVVKFYGAANAVWFDEPRVFPSDFELGATARASLSPHVSLVGSALYGFGHSYVVGTVGGRITATDVDDPNFSIGLGMVYQASSEPDIRPEEWCPDVTLGWRPWPEELPRWIIGMRGAYGMDTNTASATAAVRYEIGGR